MAWKVIMNNGEAFTDNFREIDMNNIKTLSTDTVANLSIDMNNGNVMINGELVTRNQVFNHYNKGPYKPIQYRKVVNYIGMYDFDNLQVELEKKDKTPEIHYILELLKKRLDMTITESEMNVLAKFVFDYTGQIPFREFEVQTIGYSYNFNNKKVQVEFTADPEIDSIMMTETVTDLIEEKKEAPYRIRLI